MKSDSPRTVAAIVHYRGIADTVWCLRQLAAVPGLEVVVVDNASGDDLAALLPDLAPFRKRDGAVADNPSPGLTLITVTRNRGFAAGANLAAHWALDRGAEYLLVVNPDVELPPRLVDTLVGVADAHPEAAVISPLIRHENGDLWFAGATIRWSEAALAHSEPPDDTVWEAGDYVVLCVALLRLEALRRVGFLEERFFLYFEDVALGQRLRRQGYRLLVCRAGDVRHRGGASSGGRHSALADYYFLRNSLVFFRSAGPLRLYARTARYLLSRLPLTLTETGGGRRAAALCAAYLHGIIGRAGEGPRWLDPRAAPRARRSDLLVERITERGIWT
jgi:hypothetical protein